MPSLCNTCSLWVTNSLVQQCLTEYSSGTYWRWLI